MPRGLQAGAGAQAGVVGNPGAPEPGAGGLSRQGLGSYTDHLLTAFLSLLCCDHPPQSDPWVCTTAAAASPAPRDCQTRCLAPLASCLWGPLPARPSTPAPCPTHAPALTSFHGQVHHRRLEVAAPSEGDGGHGHPAGTPTGLGAASPRGGSPTLAGAVGHPPPTQPAPSQCCADAVAQRGLTHGPHTQPSAPSQGRSESRPAAGVTMD